MESLLGNAPQSSTPLPLTGFTSRTKHTLQWLLGSFSAGGRWEQKQRAAWGEGEMLGTCSWWPMALLCRSFLSQPSSAHLNHLGFALPFLCWGSHWGWPRGPPGGPGILEQGADLAVISAKCWAAFHHPGAGPGTQTHFPQVFLQLLTELGFKPRELDLKSSVSH